MFSSCLCCNRLMAETSFPLTLIEQQRQKRSTMTTVSFCWGSPTTRRGTQPSGCPAASWWRSMSPIRPPAKLPASNGERLARKSIMMARGGSCLGSLLTVKHGATRTWTRYAGTVRVRGGKGWLVIFSNHPEHCRGGRRGACAGAPFITLSINT